MSKIKWLPSINACFMSNIGYVAITRDREEVIMYTGKYFESKFITEIKDFVKTEELNMRRIN